MKRISLFIVFLVMGVALSVYVAVRRSLPSLDGERALQGLSSAVIVERDALGVPTVRGSDRLDVASATGFVHAQDRFFQMDLMRRVAAGEVSALVGANALELDKRRRIHGLRAVAQEALASSGVEERALLEAYTLGVNAGLEALAARPFEYLILQTRPERWLPEDTILVAHAMFFQLNDADASGDASRARLQDTLPGELHDFVTAPGSEWEAPLLGNAREVPPVPGPAVCDMRSDDATRQARAPSRAHPFVTEEPLAGSNSWAVAGERSATGRSIVANDMHLDLGVPNVWYRMRLIVDAPSDEALDLTGVTLPGAPVIVAGSNGSVAWGFTNSRGDWSDLVLLELDPSDSNAYRTPDGFRPFGVHSSLIEIKGGEPVTFTSRSTIWGPVIGEDHRGRLRALRWLAHEPEATNLRLAQLEQAGDVHEAASLAPTIGIPPQNLMLADADGNIAWTIIGRIPKRAGYDPKVPADWSDGETGWLGWLAPQDYPLIINPDSGYVWTANARVIEGESLELIGDGGYNLGARARQIRDGLLALSDATVEDMLAIQLDDRALFHEPWRELLLSVLSDNATAGDFHRGELRDVVAGWDGYAAIDSAGYRMVREFRRQAREELLSHIVSDCGDAEGPVALRRMYQTEGPLWRLVTERPAHMLPNGYSDWDELLLAMADAAAATCARDSLAACTWGEINIVEIAHPLSSALPFLGPWLDVYDGPLPGGDYTPRLQQRAHGASERFAVSPGDETRGYFHMPGGQSGHPLSPFYRAGHSAWVNGEPLPFLPGPSQHTLTLLPAEKNRD